MPKSRRAFLLESARTALVGLGGIAAGAVTPQAISTPKLSDLSPRLGVVRAGTVIAGDEAGTHTIMGQRVNGIAMYSAPNRLVFYVSPENDGRMRIGALDKPGITMANGTVHIEGDCIVDGTIKASKLQLGKLAQTFLTEDRLQIGRVDENGLVTGFYADYDDLAFYSRGNVILQLDAVTGSLVGPGWPYYGIAINGTNLRVSSRYGYAVDQAKIKFDSYYVDEVGNHEPMDFVNLYSVGASVYFTTDGGGIPSIKLGADEPAAEWGADKLKLDYGHLNLLVQSDKYALQAYEDRPLFITNLRASVVLSGYHIWCTGGFVPPYGATDQKYNGQVYFDTTLKKLRVWVDGTWKNVAFEA